ncbi:hypothetical protein GQX74_011175 [Glossina fuscipes]|nr:hypothetical protein GQX74_011175 [Glossina fuscipes]
MEKEDTYNVNETLVPSNQFKTEINNQRDKSLVLRETNVALGLQEASGERPDLGEDKNTVGVSVIFIENESEEVKSKVNRDEVGKVNNPGSSLVSAGLEDMRNRKKHLLSLNPKFNYRPHQLCENPHLNSRQTETTELGEFVKNAVETSTPGVNRKLPVQEMEKDNVAIPTANRPKRWRLSGLRRTGISPKK